MQGSGIELESFKDYSEGDDLRFLDWNAMAGARAGWESKLHIESVGLVSKLFKVEDDYVSQLSPSLCVQTSHSITREGVRQREAHITFDAAAGRERLLLARIEVEEAQHELGASTTRLIVVFEQRHELPSRTVADVGVDDAAFRLLLESRPQLRERHDLRMVFVAQRQVQHEVLLARNAQLGELAREPGAGLRALGLGRGRRTRGARPRRLAGHGRRPWR